MSDEWGGWQRHDGKGCPCAGEFVQVEMSDGDVDAAMWDEFCWEYSELGVFFEGYITRYRIRKPRGLTILENLIADVDEPAPAGWVRTEGLSGYDNGPLVRRKTGGGTLESLIAEIPEEVPE